MLDLALAYNRYRFLGYEFLTWLWYFVENKKYSSLYDSSQTQQIDSFSLQIGNRLVLENRQNEGLETITIKGDDAGLEEGILALRKGAVVSELNLKYNHASRQWCFTVKGESLNVSNLKFPDPQIVETKADLESAALDKIFMTEKLVDLIEDLFSRFVRQRLSLQWETQIMADIRKWIYS
ncbi:MAG TPA: hypothetical protein EYP90_06490 [Chromatiaceae bacterium]|nr:hypothetical protein [Chromatiaceae bacterium]